jgi:hypothetical protein
MSGCLTLRWLHNASLMGFVRHSPWAPYLRAQNRAKTDKVVRDSAAPRGPSGAANATTAVDQVVGPATGALRAAALVVAIKTLR